MKKKSIGSAIAALFLGMALLFSGQANAQSKAVKPTKEVLEAFQKAYPRAEAVKWELEGADYEADFNNSKRMSAVFGADGTFKESEVTLKMEAVPAIVLGEAKKLRPGHSMKEFAKITRANGDVLYEVEAAKGGKSEDLLFTPEGKPAK